MDEHTIAVVSLTIGLIGFTSSIIIFYSARKAEKINRGILSDINKAISAWQSRIMESAIEMLESRSEIIAKRSHLENTKAKYDFLKSLTENVNYIIEHFASGENTEAQLNELNMLLNTCKEITKPLDIPQEILEQYLMRNLVGAQKQDSTQKDQVKDDPK